MARARRRRARLSIRRGTARDAAAICELIRGLASYERLERQCTIAPADIRRHGFGRRPYFETLICRRNGQAIGLALYFFTYSTFLGRPTLYLEDLFVMPEARRLGAGRAVMTWLAREAVRRGCGRLEWVVLDWNALAIDFYDRLGAARMKEWLPYRLTGDALRALARAAT